MSKISILRGDDRARIKELIARAKAGLGDESMADLNTATLDGESCKQDELASAIMAIPFLTERRLVILERARAFLNRQKKEERPKVLALLEEMPESTLLLFIIEDEPLRRRGERGWENLRQYSWLLDWLKEHPDQATLIECSLPADDEMPAWIIKEAKAQQGAITPPAARLLATYVGNNTLRAGHELDKLLTYAGPSRPVSPEDVALLTAQDKEGKIFDFTDSLGERNPTKAMSEFRLLAQESEIVELAAMIQRQFRLLIQAREILDEGGKPAEIEKELRVLNFVAQKLANQARRFTMDQLLGIFQRLLSIDEGMKTGGMPGDLAYELLIAQLTA